MTVHLPAAEKRTLPYDLTVRQFDLEVEDLPLHWYDDNGLLTHALNAQLLMFPIVERFAVRSVRRHLPEVTDPVLRQAVRQFLGQEAHHGRSHDDALVLLRDQGFAIDGWLRTFHGGADLIQRFAPAWLCLSITAAIEHFTASVGACWLTEGRMPLAHPDMAALLGWHAAEEIEHKAVSFDVLRAVAPGWGRRMLGLFVAVVSLFVMLVTSTAMLVWQDPEIDLARLRRERRAAGQENIRSTRFVERHVGPYLRRDFHPDDNDDYHLAADYVRRISDRLTVRQPAKRRSA